ncbi:MAG: hypothetical protein AAF211_30575, partial [Myxococcota bacterium]
FRSGLPPRGGFRDLAVVGERLYVLDAVDERIVVLDRQGAVLGRQDVPAAPYRLGPLGDDALWVLAGTAPTLSVLPLHEGLPGAPIGAALSVPVRDAAYDPDVDRLWTVGPEDRPVRRHTGKLDGPGTEVLGWDRRTLLAGAAVPVERRPGRGVDGTRIVITPTGPAVAYTGSDRVAWDGRLEPAGLAPSGLAWHDGTLAVAARHSDAVIVLGKGAMVEELDPAPRKSLEDLGERLLFTPALWDGPAATCVGCHWDGGVDHRLHPGVGEIRWEQTRPFAGAGALRPLFTPGQAANLAVAVEGLIRGLDDRVAAPGRAPWWLGPRSVMTKHGPRELAAADVREALLAAIAAWPIERGPRFGTVPAAQWDEGVGLLVRDCVHCHEAVLDSASRERIPDERLADVLGDKPVAFSARLFASAGPPAFTERGNRVPPLWQLDRGGPFLSDGSASTLAELIDHSDPRAERVHGHSGPPHYLPRERDALVAVLLSL